MSSGRLLLHLLLWGLWLLPVTLLGDYLLRPTDTNSPARAEALDRDATRVLDAFLRQLDALEQPQPGHIELLQRQRPPAQVLDRGRLALARRLLDRRQPEPALELLQATRPANLGRLAGHAAWLEADAIDEAGRPREQLLDALSRSLRLGRGSHLELDALLLRAERLADDSVEAALSELDAHQGVEHGAHGQLELGALRTRLLARAGRADEAAQVAAELLVDHPVELARGRGRLLETELEKLAGSALEQLPVERRELRAESLYRAGLARSAARAYEQLPASARDWPLRIRRAELAVRLRQPHEALRLLRGLPEDGSEQARAGRYWRARAELARRRSSSYVSEMRELRASGDPAWGARAAASLVRYRQQRDDFERLLAAVDSLASLYPDYEELDEALWSAAWTLRQRGQHTQAEQRFRQLSELCPDSVWALAARYWLGRAAELRGEPEAAAQAFLELTSMHRGGFYGVAALRRLERLASQHPELARYHEQGLESLRQLPPPSLLPRVDSRLADDVAELRRLGLVDAAERELGYRLDRQPEDAGLMLLLADVEHQRGRHLDAVRWLWKALPESQRVGAPEPYARVLFPLRFRELIDAEARRSGLDPWFVAAVILQESRFQQDARSPAGAMGLMQIMPSTGRWIARKLGERADYTPRRLYDPQLNVRYGTYYMAHLLEQHDGQPELALASYNAGGGRVRSWLKRYPHAELDEFVESIPFTETRIYVKNILTGYFHYRQLYAGAQGTGSES